MEKRERQIIAGDFETDPFKRHRIPQPFVAGMYDGTTFEYNWDDDPIACAIWVLEYARAWGDDAIIFFHNGGKFDLHFIIKYADTITDIVMIGSRIVQARINGCLFRDSYAMIPAPLAAYKKTEFDYTTLEKDVRHQHYDYIVSYLKDDCVNLHEMVTGFIGEFGLHMTMASAALKQLAARHPYKKMQTDMQDKLFRKFYYGGRVQCFETGAIKANVKVPDVNSMYPDAMKRMKHPVTDEFHCHSGKAAHHENTIKTAAFMEVDATCHGPIGAFPWRDPEDKERKLYFPTERHTYFVTGHEFRKAVELDLITVHSIRRAYIAARSISFEEFVDHFYKIRLEAKAAGNKLYTLFYKLIMNSAYGKFAQDPTKFRDFEFSDGVILDPAEGWVLVWFCPDSNKRIYERPSRSPAFIGRHNVATAASITGAARATLLNGLHHATRPIYCDTDSIICEDLTGVKLDPIELGAWDIEAEGDELFIVGRKTYALFKDGVCVKKASKGVNATGEELARIANGETLEFVNEAPTFSLKKPTHFVTRNIRIT